MAIEGWQCPDFPVNLPPTSYTFEPANENRAKIQEVADPDGIALHSRVERDGDTLRLEQATGTAISYFTGGEGLVSAFTPSDYPSLISVRADRQVACLSNSFAYGYSPTQFTGRLTEVLLAVGKSEKGTASAYTSNELHNGPGKVFESQTGLAIYGFSISGGGPKTDTGGLIVPDQPSVVWLKIDSPDPVGSILAHEWMHAARKDSKKAPLVKFFDARVKAMALDEMWSLSLFALPENYTDAQRPDELVGNIFSDALTGQNAWGSEELFDNNWPAVRKLAKTLWEKANPLRTSGLKEQSDDAIYSQSPRAPVDPASHPSNTTQSANESTDPRTGQPSLITGPAFDEGRRADVSRANRGRMEQAQSLGNELSEGGANQDDVRQAVESSGLPVVSLAKLGLTWRNGELIPTDGTLRKLRRSGPICG